MTLAPRPPGRPAGWRAPACAAGWLGTRWLLGRLLGVLLAVALATSGGMGPVRAGEAALAPAKAPAPALCGAGMARHEAHGPAQGASHDPLAGCDGGERHEHDNALCSLCLLARSGVEVAGPGVPPRPLVAQALRWIGPAALVPPEVHPRIPPARGPPSFVI